MIKWTTSTCNIHVPSSNASTFAEGHASETFTIKDQKLRGETEWLYRFHKAHFTFTCGMKVVDHTSRVIKREDEIVLIAGVSNAFQTIAYKFVVPYCSVVHWVTDLDAVFMPPVGVHADDTTLCSWPLQSENPDANDLFWHWNTKYIYPIWTSTRTRSSGFFKNYDKV